MNLRGGGEDGGRDSQGAWDGRGHTAVFNMENRQDMLDSTGTAAPVAAWLGGAFGGEWTHPYVWLSLLPVHCKLTQHCLRISYTPIQNKTFFKKIRSLHLSPADLWARWFLTGGPLQGSLGLPTGPSGKESACQCRRPRFHPWLGKIPWRRKWPTHSSLLAWRIPQTEVTG